jgi:hypothetical protein
MSKTTVRFAMQASLAAPHALVVQSSANPRGTFGTVAPFTRSDRISVVPEQTPYSRRTCTALAARTASNARMTRHLSSSCPYGVVRCRCSPLGGDGGRPIPVQDLRLVRIRRLRPLQAVVRGTSSEKLGVFNAGHGRLCSQLSAVDGARVVVRPETGGVAQGCTVLRQAGCNAPEKNATSRWGRVVQCRLLGASRFARPRGCAPSPGASHGASWQADSACGTWAFGKCFGGEGLQAHVCYLGERTVGDAGLVPTADRCAESGGRVLRLDAQAQARAARIRRARERRAHGCSAGVWGL